MKKERLNSIELLIVNGLRKMLQLELRKRFPLIETIRACAKEAEKQYTLQEFLIKNAHTSCICRKIVVPLQSQRFEE